MRTKLKRDTSAASRAPRKKNTFADLPPAALKFKEACRYLGGIHPATLRRLMDRGLIRSNRTLRCHLFPVSELERVLREGMVE